MIFYEDNNLGSNMDQNSRFQLLLSFIGKKSFAYSNIDKSKVVDQCYFAGGEQ